MRFFFTSLMLILVVAVQGAALQAPLAKRAGPSAFAENLAGRWRVKFTLPAVGEKNLVFNSQAKGTGSFLLLDTGPDGTAVADSLPAAWAQTTNDRVSFSGEVELPIGTCCREIGTLLFKGKISSANYISGKVIFITTTTDEESPYGLRSMMGTFTATRVIN